MSDISILKDICVGYVSVVSDGKHYSVEEALKLELVERCSHCESRRDAENTNGMFTCDFCQGVGIVYKEGERHQLMTEFCERCDPLEAYRTSGNLILTLHSGEGYNDDIEIPIKPSMLISFKGEARTFGSDGKMTRFFMATTAFDLPSVIKMLKSKVENHRMPIQSDTITVTNVHKREDKDGETNKG